MQVVGDESHSIKNKDSQRAKFAVPLMKRANHRILLSGNCFRSATVTMCTHTCRAWPLALPRVAGRPRRLARG